MHNDSVSRLKWAPKVLPVHQAHRFHKFVSNRNRQKRGCSGSQKSAKDWMQMGKSEQQDESSEMSVKQSI